MFLSAAAVCFDDDKQTKPASDYVDKAIEHSEGLLANTLKTEDSALAELKRAQEEVDKIMSAFRIIEEREEMMHKPKKIDPDLEEDQQVEAPVSLKFVFSYSSTFIRLSYTCTCTYDVRLYTPHLKAWRPRVTMP